MGLVTSLLRSECSLFNHGWCFDSTGWMDAGKRKKKFFGELGFLKPKPTPFRASTENAERARAQREERREKRHERSEEREKNQLK